MVRKIDSGKMGRSEQTWLHSWFHFSFAEYYNPDNIEYGVLRVVNDDLIEPGTGFDTHPHKDMEIITYVVEGELTHADNINNQSTLTRGEIQYMSAGTGVEHSEYNHGSELLRLLQIWVYPDRTGCPPSYGDYRFPWESRINKWFLMISGEEGTAPVKIHQDALIYATWLEAGKELIYRLPEGRQAYLIQIEGESSVNETTRLAARDAAEISAGAIGVRAETDSHLLLFDMER